MAKRVLLVAVSCTVAAWAGDFNEVILRQVASMPAGGGYATTASAHQALTDAVRLDASGLSLHAAAATPSYCSGATYLVFLKTLVELQRRGDIRIDRTTFAALLPGKVADGEGVWGRWNANGPGTPRLFHELGIGRNFTAFEDARPGDFLKIFWTGEVGASERGHSVIFLGLQSQGGIECVRFWSSNKPGGYGEKSVPRQKISGVIFSRLESPELIGRAAELPRRDPYLAGLLARRSSFAEAARLCGFPWPRDSKRD
ncbi:MAG: hypothetical protein WCS65_07015 [Verrucomicrobiae bacterium]